MSALEFEEWKAVFRIEHEEIEAMRKGRRPASDQKDLEREIQQSLSGFIR